MTDIVVAGSGPGQRRVLDVAAALADVLQATVRSVSADEVPENEVTAERMLAELQAPGAVLGVVPVRRERNSLWRPVIARATKPIVLVPQLTRPGRRPIRRALVPLDGTPGSAAAVRDTTSMLAAAGVEIVFLHVFVESSTPRYWDQPAHAEQAWEQEFRARYCATEGALLGAHSGVPDDHVVATATTADADLIVLGWSQDLAPGRAAVVRRAVAGVVPVLLLPVTPPATNANGSGVP